MQPKNATSPKEQLNATWIILRIHIVVIIGDAQQLYLYKHRSTNLEAHSLARGSLYEAAEWHVWLIFFFLQKLDVYMCLIKLIGKIYKYLQYQINIR